MSEGRRKPRRHSKLTRAESERAVAFLCKASKKERYPCVYLSRMLGCSYRTASRILSETRPYASHLPREFACRFSTKTGIPLEFMLGEFDVDYKEALKGWERIVPASIAGKMAALLAAGISSRAMTFHGLFARYQVDYGTDGRPCRVWVFLCQECSMERGKVYSIEFYERTNYGFSVKCRKPSEDVFCHGQPDEHKIENALKYIKYESEQRAAERHKRDKARAKVPA